MFLGNIFVPVSLKRSNSDTNSKSICSSNIQSNPNIVTNAKTEINLLPNHNQLKSNQFEMKSEIQNIHQNQMNYNLVTNCNSLNTNTIINNNNRNNNRNENENNSFVINSHQLNQQL